MKVTNTSDSGGELPRVTYALFAFNQESYIADAIRSALGQTYLNLEIIISDDASVDNTASIIRKMVSNYSGTHDLVVNLRGVNQGWAAHVNEVMGMASGELIVVAAGDDVSHLERVSILVEAWLSNGRPAGIASGMRFIDEGRSFLGGTPGWLVEQSVRLKELTHAEILDTHLGETRIRFTGCSAAWSKDNWEYFGPINRDVNAEDEVLSYRACLRGGVAFVDAELVDYRQHDSNLWSVNKNHKWDCYRDVVRSDKEQARRFGYAVASCVSMLADLLKLQHCLSSEVYESHRTTLNARLSRAIVRRDWWQLSVFQRLVHLDVFSSRSLIHRISCLFPHRIYACLKFFLYKCSR